LTRARKLLIKLAHTSSEPAAPPADWRSPVFIFAAIASPRFLARCSIYGIGCCGFNGFIAASLRPHPSSTSIGLAAMGRRDGLPAWRLINAASGLIAAPDLICFAILGNGPL
jgi:hypothetical protein